jgi:hypothetical protein
MYSVKIISEYKITDTLMPRTLIWPSCIDGMCVADGTRQTSRWLPLTFKHLSYCGTKTFFWYRRNQCQVSLTWRWQLALCWHMLQIPCYQVFLKGSKKIVINGHENGTVGSMVCNYPAVAP